MSNPWFKFEVPYFSLTVASYKFYKEKKLQWWTWRLFVDTHTGYISIAIPFVGILIQFGKK